MRSQSRVVLRSDHGGVAIKRRRDKIGFDGCTVQSHRGDVEK